MISNTLEVTWELIQYIVIAVRRYLDHGLGLREDQSYTFTKIMKGRTKGRMIEP